MFPEKIFKGFSSRSELNPRGGCHLHLGRRITLRDSAYCAIQVDAMISVMVSAELAQSFRDRVPSR